MSVLSIMKKGRQQAKEQTVKESEKDKNEQAKVTYKHVPTHAAVDALSGAPSSWQQDYRSRIREQNERRNSLVASERNSKSMPRVSSSLSNVSYPLAHASPVVPISKVHSSSSLPPAWQQRSPLSYTKDDYFSQPMSRKGKEREAIPPVPPLPLMKNGRVVGSNRSSSRLSTGAYRVGSSGNSSSSEDDLEVRHVRPVSLSASYATASRGAHGRSSHRGTDSPSLHMPHQRTVSAQSNGPYSQSSRAHRFTAPQPMNQALGVTGSIASFPAPPSSTIGSATSSPEISNSVSYASSAMSGGSTASSSAASTPAASVIASFPSAEKLAPLMSNGSQKTVTSKNIDQAERETSHTSDLNKKYPPISKSGHRANVLTKSRPHSISDMTKGPVTSPEVQSLRSTKKNRWSFLSSKRPAATAA
ncbi:hypothetical protein SCAR479_12023 [Seiridium cardinale]|uniref:Uncharacterized protein n=1 Tax=Seiridium cardinale TaxID=138064 RepID=A0ABR2XC25_9PEZI